MTEVPSSFSLSSSCTIYSASSNLLELPLTSPICFGSSVLCSMEVLGCDSLPSPASPGFEAVIYPVTSIL